MSTILLHHAHDYGQAFDTSLEGVLRPWSQQYDACIPHNLPFSILVSSPGHILGRTPNTVPNVDQLTPYPRDY